MLPWIRDHLHTEPSVHPWNDHNKCRTWTKVNMGTMNDTLSTETQNFVNMTLRQAVKAFCNAKRERDAHFNKKDTKIATPWSAVFVRSLARVDLLQGGGEGGGGGSLAERSFATTKFTWLGLLGALPSIRGCKKTKERDM